MIIQVQVNDYFYHFQNDEVPPGFYIIRINSKALYYKYNKCTLEDFKYIAEQVYAEKFL